MQDVFHLSQCLGMLLSTSGLSADLGNARLRLLDLVVYMSCLCFNRRLSSSTHVPLSRQSCQLCKNCASDAALLITSTSPHILLTLLQLKLVAVPKSLQATEPKARVTASLTSYQPSCTGRSHSCSGCGGIVVFAPCSSS